MKVIAIGTLAASAILIASARPVWSADCGGKGSAGVPCSCGDTVIADRTLTSSDPVVSADPSQKCAEAPYGNGLTVADGVKLDLGGLVIRGSGAIFGDGITLGTGSVVKNGKIRDFGTGVNASGGTGATIKAINLAGIGIGIWSGPSAVIVDNTIRDYCGSGIEAGDGSAVSANNIQRCSLEGIKLVSNVTVARNSVRFSGFGIAMDPGSGRNTFLENNISDNQFGFYETPGSAGANRFVRNRANRNDRSGGIEVGSGNNAFLGNGASDNAGNGITADDPSNIDDGSNTGSGNSGPVQCEIGGSPCK